MGERTKDPSSLQAQRTERAGFILQAVARHANDRETVGRAETEERVGGVGQTHHAWHRKPFSSGTLISFLALAV